MATSIVDKQEILLLEKKALDVVKSRFLLCILVTQRIHQLEKGAKPCVDIDEELFIPKNYYELALREMIEGEMDLEQIES
jgi:DNA-directed RNA polymerase subunit K/omega